MISKQGSPSSTGPQGQFTSIGGQAVIEGVMMRSPHFIAVAVRRADRKIIIKNFPYQGISSRYPILKKPVFRGVVGLIESMVQGVGALSYAANIASVEVDSPITTAIASSLTGSGATTGIIAAIGANHDHPLHGKTTEKAANDPEGELSSFAIFMSIATALTLGLGFFVVLPHALTAFITSRPSIGLTAQSPFFHLIDGSLKMILLLGYVYLIAFMKDIKRVFQYHGAEHKSIYTFEAGEELTVENARKHTTLHPRCGTSFLLFLVVISIATFSIVFPLFHLTELAANPILNHALMIVIKMFLMLPVAGLAYEFIKMCACRMDSPIFRVMIWPGMILQKLTTREPEDDQLEVALASLRLVLKLEVTEKSKVELLKSNDLPSKKLHTDKNGKSDFKKEWELPELEISSLSEIGLVSATVAEFPEI